MSGKENLTDTLSQVMAATLANVNVSIPAKVISYDYKEQRASVQPVIRRKYADGKTEDYPIINNVPVMFPRSGGASMTFPVLAGDTVLLIFCDRTIDLWAANGGVQTQDDPRNHSYNDAVAIPGLISFSIGSKAINNEDVLITYQGSNVIIKPSGDILIQAPNVRIESDTVHMTGDLTVEGQIVGEQDITAQADVFDNVGALDALRQTYNDHRHVENDDGGPTEPPDEQA